MGEKYFETIALKMREKGFDELASMFEESEHKKLQYLDALHVSFFLKTYCTRNESIQWLSNAGLSAEMIKWFYTQDYHYDNEQFLRMRCHVIPNQ